MKRIVVRILLLILALAALLGVTALAATTITAGSTKTVNITTGGQEVEFTFTPAATAGYSFYSDGTYDTYCTLYDASGNVIETNDDGGEERNFLIKRKFTANERYTFKARMYSSSATGSFSVKLERYNGLVSATAVKSSFDVRPNRTATLEVNAVCTSGSLTYAWYGTTNSSSSGSDSYTLISGATGSRYTTPALKRSERYYCRVTDENGISIDVSFWVSIDNDFETEILGSGTLYVDLYDTAELEVWANCYTGSLHYQWYVSTYDATSKKWSGDTLLSGKTSKSISITVTTNSSYRCDVSDDYGASRSRYFSVHVDNRFSTVAVSRETQTVALNSAADLIVSASCQHGSLHYEWKVKDVNWDTVEGISSSTNVLHIPKVQGYLYITCEIYDDYGNSESYYFDVYVDNALTAKAKGNTSFTVTPEGTLKLAVEASCAKGALTYKWCQVEEEEYDEGYWDYWEMEETTTPSYTVPQDYLYTGKYLCIVCDQYGDEAWVFFTVFVDSGLTAKASGSTTVSVTSGGSVTLKVTASVDYGEIDYYWNYGGGSDPSITLHDVTSNRHVICDVWDEYGNSIVVPFNVKVSTYPTLPLNEWVSIYTDDPYLCSFKPTKTGYYMLDNRNGGAEVTLYDSSWNEVDHSYYDPLVSRLTANKQYYFDLLCTEDTETEVLLVELFQDDEARHINLKVGQTVMLPQMLDLADYSEYMCLISEDESVVSVYEGRLTAEKTGTATVWLVDELIMSKYEISVYSASAGLTLPAALETVEANAFSGDKATHFVTLYPSVKSVTSGAFANTDLKQLAIYGAGTQLNANALSGSTPTILCPFNSAAVDWAKSKGYDDIVFIYDWRYDPYY
ncbi:MAG: hypothetical protein E7317_01075 [Clostridiales bacterium]|nr:hypothetical protein [Clostridiales bacterium]